MGSCQSCTLRLQGGGQLRVPWSGRFKAAPLFERAGGPRARLLPPASPLRPSPQVVDAGRRAPGCGGAAVPRPRVSSPLRHFPHPRSPAGGRAGRGRTHRGRGRRGQQQGQEQEQPHVRLRERPALERAGRARGSVCGPAGGTRPSLPVARRGPQRRRRTRGKAAGLRGSHVGEKRPVYSWLLKLQEYLPPGFQRGKREGNKILAERQVRNQSNQSHGF